MLVQAGVQYRLLVQILKREATGSIIQAGKGAILAHFVVEVIALGLYTHFISVMKSYLKRLESIFL